jgi:Tfp pilus assembly protein FimT
MNPYHEDEFMLPELKSHKGFTLMELVIIVSMVAVLSSVAMPRIIDQLSHQKLRATARDISSAFQQAKLQAVNDDENVVFQFSPAAYVPDGGVGSYLIFRDDGTGGGTPGNLSQDGGEPTLKTLAMPKGVSLISASFTDGSTTNSIGGFDGEGLSAGTRSGSVQVRTRDRWYRITLSVAGNVRMQISSDGIHWST